VLLAGDAIGELTPRGEPIHDDTLLVLVNAGKTDVAFVLPSAGTGRGWTLELDTAQPDDVPTAMRAVHQYATSGRSLVLLRSFWVNGHRAP
jgi:glycogen operon protein